MKRSEAFYVCYSGDHDIFDLLNVPLVLNHTLNLFPSSGSLTAVLGVRPLLLCFQPLQCMRHLIDNLYILYFLEIIYLFIAVKKRLLPRCVGPIITFQSLQVYPF